MVNDPLELALQNCSLHPLLIVVTKLLIRAGFGDIEIMDRRTRRQKTRHGGFELSCYTMVGSTRAKVIMKVMPDPVRLRMFDELAGAVDRSRADLGVLVTPRRLSPRMASRHSAYTRSRIEVLDGSDLARLARNHQVGVRPTGDVDYAFFGELELASDRFLPFLEKEGL